MKEVFIFLAEGFEEIEAIAIIDVLRRGEVKVTSVSVTGNKSVNGAHGIEVIANSLFEYTDFSNGAMLILPGGMPGASNLNKHEGLKQLLLKHNLGNKKLAAICAAPLVFGELGILKNKNATCYPGFESRLIGANLIGEPVVTDGNITTGKGPGFAVDFALSLVAELQGEAKADEVATGMLLK